ncbi:MFS transporter [Actinoplanes couchii]|uniref:Sugar efflux transporter SetB n=1 Tax=Actinoplanes couchii TaxID=403638 RepID=A0ABQ3X890_9ACTN|nr:MFS transporter [Actinoplanes couchii]MDR6320354.1 SET family sugar efflux transporter-like MFS transporter [Actinoplanes couchii]GID54633.1 sugar efflux transporter SetB [Actinoplanes couchii]
MIRTVLRTPLYRGVTIALFLSGVGFSAPAPLMSLFLVDELGASLSTAGLFALTNLTAPLAGYLIGARSDRVGDRLGLFRLCAVLGCAGWVAIAFAGQLWVPVVVNTVVLCFAGAATSQLFAAVQDRPVPGIDGVIAILRIALVGGWVVGPVLGSLLAAWTDVRTMFLATAVCLLAQIVPLGRQRSTAVTHDVSAPSTAPGLRQMLPLIVFTTLSVLVYAGDTVKFAYLPVYMNRDLHLSSGLSGAIIGAQPLTEILVIPIAIAAARRFGAMRVLTASCVLAVAGTFCLAVGTTAATLFAGQILIGFLWGTFGGLGIIVAQRLLPSAIATASAVFISAEPVSAAVGGLAGGLGVNGLGLPGVFLIPTALAAVAALGLAWMTRRYPSPAPARPAALPAAR